MTQSVTIKDVRDILGSDEAMFAFMKGRDIIEADGRRYPVLELEHTAPWDGIGSPPDSPYFDRRYRFYVFEDDVVDVDVLDLLR